MPVSDRMAKAPSGLANDNMSILPALEIVVDVDLTTKKQSDAAKSSLEYSRDI